MIQDSEPIRSQIETILEELSQYFKELRGESARAAAILAVAAMEDSLETLLRAQFPAATSNTLWRKLAGPGFKPLGSLSAKADFAQAFGFFGSKTRNAIELVGNVRNKFAHQTDIRTFDHPKILEVCKRLENNPVFPFTLAEHCAASDIRWNYIQTVKCITNEISEIITHDPEFDEPLKKLP